MVGSTGLWYASADVNFLWITRVHRWRRDCCPLKDGGVTSVGVVHRSQISLPRRELEVAIRGGALTRISRGWYATPTADPQVVRAVGLGGRLTCVSAAKVHGLWVMPDARLHLALRVGDAKPTAPGLVWHRLSSAGWETPEPVLDVEHCVADVLAHHSVAVGLMVIESAVDRGVLTEATARRLIQDTPSHRRRSGLQHFDPRSGSGSETWVRLWFQRRNVPVRTQVQIAGVGRVDMVVGESWVVEVDSVAHHTSIGQFEEDRRRDLVLTSLGFQVTRLSYSQVFRTWPATASFLRQVLATGRYRLSPSGAAQIYLPVLPYAA